MYDIEVMDIIINTDVKVFSSIYRRLIRYIKQALLDIKNGIIYGLKKLTTSTIISLVVMALTYLLAGDLLVKLVIAIFNIKELFNISKRNIWFVTGFAIAYISPWILANLLPILFIVPLIHYYITQTFILGIYTFISHLIIELKKAWGKYRFIGIIIDTMLLISRFMMSAGIVLFIALY